MYGLAATKTAAIYLIIAISSKLQCNNLPAALSPPSRVHI
jgi:hypothetical protein